jgi:hypothetical protein
MAAPITDADNGSKVWGQAKGTNKKADNADNEDKKKTNEHYVHEYLSREGIASDSRPRRWFRANDYLRALRQRSIHGAGIKMKMRARARS